MRPKDENMWKHKWIIIIFREFESPGGLEDGVVGLGVVLHVEGPEKGFSRRKFQENRRPLCWLFGRQPQKLGSDLDIAKSVGNS